jgi:hypothetical protein
MIIYVFLYHFICNVTTCYTEVSSCPKVSAPISLFQLWKLLLNFSGTFPFHCFYQITFTHMGWYRYKNMYMIRGNNSTYYLDIKFLSNLRNYLTNSPLQCSPENFVTVFGNPNNMISMVIFGMRSFAIGFHTKSLTNSRLEVEGFNQLEDYKIN